MQLGGVTQALHFKKRDSDAVVRFVPDENADFDFRLCGIDNHGNVVRFVEVILVDELISGRKEDSVARMCVKPTQDALISVFLLQHFVDFLLSLIRKLKRCAA